MAQSFTTNEARQLIEEQQSLLRRLKNVPEVYNTQAAAAVNTARQLIGQQTLSAAIESAILYDQPFRERGSACEPLIRALYYCKALFPVKTECEGFLSLNESAILSSIEDLKKGGIGFGRVFSSAQKKELAAQAYEALRQRTEGAYLQTATNLINRAEQIMHADDETVWRDFSAYCKQYEEFLLNLAPGIGKEGLPVRIFGAQLAACQRTENEVAADQERRRSKENGIRQMIQKITWRDMVRILQGVPVEEASRKQSGLRVKALHDAGYNSIADVYSASVYQLAGVKGISEDTAWNIKRIAEDYAREAQKTVKLQLSTDRKTQESSALVNALFQYRNYLNNAKEFYALDDAVREQKRYAVSLLGNTHNGLSYVFASGEERKQLADAYYYLKGLLSDNYTVLLKRLSAGSNHIYFSDAAWQDFEANAAEYYTLLEQIEPDILGNGDSLYGLPEDLAREINEESFFPDGLLCTLRRYQEWGVKYILHQKRVLLGDEMGLGKTVQAIAAMVSLRNTGATHFIVVCPASVIVNWCREVVKHSKLRVTRVHGAGRLSAFNAWRKTGGVAVTTYESVGALPLDGLKFDLLTADEAHYIKNPEAARTKNLKALAEHTQRLLFMTGTPLENHVDEMVRLIEILRPDMAVSLRSVSFMSAAEQFRSLIAPVYYRRKREDVLTELPELIQTQEWCTLSQEERDVYNRLSSDNPHNYAIIRRVSWHIDDLKRSSKATRMMELVEEAAQDGRKVLVFSFFLDTLRKTALLLGDRCTGIINGSVPPSRRQEILDDFEKAPAGSVLVAQIQSGGTGLNIQSASVVIICEPQLKPSTETQAISRAYRMGQARNVLVYRLLCPNTIDERIVEMLEKKQREFDAFADKSVAAEESVAIDEKTLGSIIQEEIDRINAELGRSSAQPPTE